jgi:hypothetical protein
MNEGKNRGSCSQLVGCRRVFDWAWAMNLELLQNEKVKNSEEKGKGAEKQPVLKTAGEPLPSPVTAQLPRPP